MYFLLGVCYRGETGFLNFNDICMCAVNKQFHLCFKSVYVDLKYNEISHIFTPAGSVNLRGVCRNVVVIGLSVRLSWYAMWIRRLRRLFLFCFVSLYSQCAEYWINPDP